MVLLHRINNKQNKIDHWKFSFIFICINPTLHFIYLKIQACDSGCSGIGLLEIEPSLTLLTSCFRPLFVFMAVALESNSATTAWYMSLLHDRVFTMYMLSSPESLSDSLDMYSSLNASRTFCFLSASHDVFAFSAAFRPSSF